ncbi:hypothetical protein SAMN05660742_12116 [Propionispira arboris]|uniref:Uncharacterized protein n=1 Tax=Propionispira arboris TaxID=84035 RepID=A0A1H7CNT2_9FIRM|nr:hypothetical protein SAMN05660742_12116 [Propionispira arboris]
MICVHVAAGKNTRIAAVAINKQTALKYIFGVDKRAFRRFKDNHCRYGKKA